MYRNNQQAPGYSNYSNSGTNYNAYNSYNSYPRRYNNFNRDNKRPRYQNRNYNSNYRYNNQNAITQYENIQKNVETAQKYTNARPLTEKELEELHKKQQEKAAYSEAAREALKPKNTNQNSQNTSQNTSTNPSTSTENKTTDNLENIFEIQTAKKTDLAAAAPTLYIKGKSHTEKTRFLDQTFGKFPSYTGSASRKLNSVAHYVIYFQNEEDLTQALKIELPFTYYTLENQSPQTNNDTNNTTQTTTNKKQGMFSFTRITELVTPVSEEQRETDRHNTIKVIDIPLNIQTPTIRAIFSNYGTIKYIRMTTKKLYQHAIITFDENDCNIDKFRNNELWSIYVLRHAVRIYPFSLSSEFSELRNKFQLKLTGLPNNTTARDIHDFLNNIKAKTCFIPRNNKTYKPLLHAYISFENEQQLQDALKQQCKLGNYNLRWTQPEQQTCSICGSPEHFQKFCQDPRNNNNKNKNNLNSLYNRYLPANHRKPRFNNNPNFSQNRRQNYNISRNEVDLIMKGMQQLQSSFKLMQYQIATLRQDMNKSLPNNKQQTTSISPSQNTNDKGKRAMEEQFHDTHTTYDIASSSNQQNNNNVNVIQERQSTLESNFSKLSNELSGITSKVSQLLSKISSPPEVTSDDGLIDFTEDDYYNNPHFEQEYSAQDPPSFDRMDI